MADDISTSGDHHEFTPISLSAERKRRRPPSMSPPDKLYQACQLIREYADELAEKSVRDFGAIDTACAEMTTFADCVHRIADAFSSQR